MKPITHKDVDSALFMFLKKGGRINRLYPSHVNHTGRRLVSARTRENKFDRSIKDYQPDNLLDLLLVQ